MSADKILYNFKLNNGIGKVKADYLKSLFYIVWSSSNSSISTFCYFHSLHSFSAL